MACNLDHLRSPQKSTVFGQNREAAIDTLRGRFGDRAAVIADQKHDRLAVIMAMRTGEKRIARGEPVHQSAFDEKIKRPIDGNGRRPFACASGQNIDHLIGADGATRSAEFIENALARFGQSQPCPLSGSRRIMRAMRMVAHGRNRVRPGAGGIAMQWIHASSITNQVQNSRCFCRCAQNR